jgi:RNA polymerase sigma factor (sigma-70 family)
MMADMTLERTDAEWLQVYVDQGSDLAFEQIVSRHGPMVYRHCFRLLHDAHEAKDTSQAVFIVLAKQAGALRKNGNLTAWLYGVTRNVCRHVLRCRRNRQRREEEGAIMLELERDSAQAIESQSVVLDLVYRELGALTSLQRQAVILRYIEGRREDNAAGLAGCSVDALHRRATDGIAKLRQRLAKRGVALGGVALASLLTSEASAAVPETLLPSILAVVKTAVATTATATGASSTAAMLAKGAMKAMFIAKVKMVAAVAAAVIVTGTAVPVGIAVAQAVSKESKLAGDYLVIDLSGGPSASNYPVGYLSAVPSGGWTDEYKTTKLVMRKIPAGTFIMGSPTNELGRYELGLPRHAETQHTVTLTKAFYLGVFEVTQRQWELVMGNKPSYFSNATCYATRPVEQVSYCDIRESKNNRAMNPTWPATNAVHADSFMGRLRAKTGVTGFDLPTESQWEYACRAGTDTALNSGHNLTKQSQDAQMNVVGRYRDNGGVAISNRVWWSSPGWETNHGTVAVGTYQANAWGLYDMHGNVQEACLDWYGTYPGTVTDPKGAAAANVSDPSRVRRGGSWYGSAGVCRSAERYPNIWPDGRSDGLGFRAAMTLP